MTHLPTRHRFLLPLLLTCHVLSGPNRAIAANDGAWAVIPSAASQIHDVIAIDPANQRVFRFGGRHEVATNAVSELRIQPTPAWRFIPAQGVGPAGRDQGTLVYDAARDRLLLFGGQSAGTPQGDLWALQLGVTPTWQLLAPGAGPSPRYGHAAIYDAPRQRMIIVGGRDGAGPLADAWALDLSAPVPTWSALGSAPGAAGRNGCGAIFDAGSNRMLVHGGADASGAATASVASLDLLTDTWSILSTVVNSAFSPARYQHALALDAVHHQLIAQGGIGVNIFSGLQQDNSDTWSLDLGVAPAVWNLRNSSAILSPKGAIRGGFVDFDGSRFVLLGSSQPDVLSLASYQWGAPLFPAGNGPQFAAGGLSAGVYDSVADRFYFYMPADGAMYSAATAAQTDWAVSPGGPANRTGCAIALDSPRRRLLVIGGGGSAEVWSYALDSRIWQLLPAALPFGLDNAGAAFDAVANRVWVYGGAQAGNVLNPDLLAFDPNTNAWTLLRMKGKLLRSPRQGMSVALDGARLLVHGGRNAAGALLADTWSVTLRPRLDSSQLPTSGPVDARAEHGAVVDAARSRMLVFGGVGSAGDLSSTRALSLATNVWASLAPVGPTPGPRADAAVAFVPGLDRMLVFGGHTGYGEFGVGQYWSLSFAAPLAAQSAVAAVSASAAPAAAGLRFTHLMASSVLGVEVELDSSFPGEAVAELFDVSGRRLSSERAVVGSGRSVMIRLAGSLALPPGVYAVRVRVGSASAVRRVVLLRQQ